MSSTIKFIKTHPEAMLPTKTEKGYQLYIQKVCEEKQVDGNIKYYCHTGISIVQPKTHQSYICVKSETLRPLWRKMINEINIIYSGNNCEIVVALINSSSIKDFGAPREIPKYYPLFELIQIGEGENVYAILIETQERNDWIGYYFLQLNGNEKEILYLDQVFENVTEPESRSTNLYGFAYLGRPYTESEIRVLNDFHSGEIYTGKMQHVEFEKDSDDNEYDSGEIDEFFKDGPGLKGLFGTSRIKI